MMKVVPRPPFCMQPLSHSLIKKCDQRRGMNQFPPNSPDDMSTTASKVRYFGFTLTIMFDKLCVFFVLI